MGLSARPFDPDKLRLHLQPYPSHRPGAMAPFFDAYRIQPDQVGWVASDVERLATYRFSSPLAKAELLLVMGYMDHVGLFRTLIHDCQRLGFNVTVFDLPGQGLSSGKRMEVNDFAQYRHAAQAVAQQLPDNGLPKFALGQSTGAGCLLDWLRTEQAYPFERMVLMNPLIRPHGWSYLQFAHWLLKGILVSIKRSHSDGTNDPEFNQFAAFGDGLRSPIIPTAWLTAMSQFKRAMLNMSPVSGHDVVVFQGTDEKTVDAPWNLKQIVKKFPGVRVHWIEGARHHLANEILEYRQPVLDELAGLIQE